MFRKRCVSCVSLSVALLVCLSAVEVAHANPLISIGDGRATSWVDAMPNIRPADALTGPAERFYPSLGRPYSLLPSDLDPFVPDQNYDGPINLDSLVMSWGEPLNVDEVGVAAWEYIYDADPDLTNTVIDFSLFAPPGIQNVSLELIDVNNKARGWFMPTVPVHVWGNYQIVANNPAPQGLFTYFAEDPGFDITQVIKIRLDEAGRSVTLPNPVPGAPPNWNAWNHLEVRPVPEPATVAMSALALTALGGYLRRRRRATS